MPGALAGGWFKTPFNPDDPFAPADWGFVSKIEADGLVYTAGPGWDVRTPPDNPTFVDPATMTTEHCYQHQNFPPKWVYVKLLSDTKVAVANGDGACPTSLPADNTIYHR